jgi:hypothetical protein
MENLARIARKSTTLYRELRRDVVRLAAEERPKKKGGLMVTRVKTGPQGGWLRITGRASAGWNGRRFWPPGPKMGGIMPSCPPRPRKRTGSGADS